MNPHSKRAAPPPAKSKNLPRGKNQNALTTNSRLIEAAEGCEFAHKRIFPQAVKLCPNKVAQQNYPRVPDSGPPNPEWLVSISSINTLDGLTE
jgi:hypothetical protein